MKIDQFEISNQFEFGVIHKVRTLRFLNFRPQPPSPSSPRPPVRAHTLLAYIPPPSMSVRILFQKRYDRDVFSELLSVKEPQTMLQNKETTVQNYREMNTQEEAWESRLRFLFIREIWKWIILAVLIAHVLLLFYNKTA